MTVDWKRGIKLLRSKLEQQSLPTYWHKNSPHTYQVWQHAVMLVFMRRYCDSYSEFVEWLPHTKLPEYMKLTNIPDEGTLCKEEKRLRPYLEQVVMLLVVSILPTRFVGSADMTGLQTKRASPYYVRRVMNSYNRRGFARLELVVWKRYILAWELRLFKKRRTSHAEKHVEEIKKETHNISLR